MSGVEIGLAAMAAGSLVGAYGQWKANEDQAEEEKKNAAYFREQAEIAQKAGDREAQLFEQDADRFYKNQIGLFAQNGIQASATALGETIRRTREGLAAIREQTAANVRLAILRGDASNDKADRLKDPTNNLLQAGGTLLTGGGHIASKASGAI